MSNIDNQSIGARQASEDRRRSTKKERGFAYLWVLMMVALMGIGLVITAEVYSTSLQREKERELIFIGRQFRTAIGRYYESNAAGGHQYPLTLDELLKDPRFPSSQRYLRHIYVDPMTGKSEWGTVLVKGRIAGVHSLSEKMPIKQDNFEFSEIGFKGKGRYADWVFTYPPELLAPTGITSGVVRSAGDIKDSRSAADQPVK